MKHKGFTLIEMIVVMVILGIIGAGMTTFIVFPLETFIHVAAQTKLVNDATILVHRLTMEMHDPTFIYNPNSTATTLNFTLNGVAVSYVCDTNNDTITRVSTPTALAAEYVTACDFFYQDPLLRVSLTMTVDNTNIYVFEQIRKINQLSIPQ